MFRSSGVRCGEELSALSNPILELALRPAGARTSSSGRTARPARSSTGRRPSESFIPVPAARKGTDEAAAGARLRRHRRAARAEHADQRHPPRGRALAGEQLDTASRPITRKLLAALGRTPTARTRCCSASARRPRRRSSSPRSPAAHGDRRLPHAGSSPRTTLHNDGLPRVGAEDGDRHRQDRRDGDADRLADAQQGRRARSDARFAKRFLVVTPGITIRDRLRVLQPERPGQLLPRARPRPARPAGRRCGRRQIVITNYHAFLPRTPRRSRASPATPASCSAAASRAPTRSRRPTARWSQRGPAATSAARQGEIVVLNDEAHHCYQDKPLERRRRADGDDEGGRGAQRARPGSGSRASRPSTRKVGVKAVYDLSATPFFLSGSGYTEGTLFPWVVSDFSLMDAIESGIVKMPRVPVDDDAAGEQPTYRDLWDHIGDDAAEDGRAARRRSDADWVPPDDARRRAAQPLRQLRADASSTGERELAALGEPPPVFIVVCNNTIVSKLVYDCIAGCEVELRRRHDDARAGQPAAALATSTTARWLDRPRTILIDSAQLESGEALKADFKQAAAARDRGVQGASTGAATPAPTSTSSPTRTCCAR